MADIYKYVVKVTDQRGALLRYESTYTLKRHDGETKTITVEVKPEEMENPENRDEVERKSNEKAREEKTNFENDILAVEIREIACRNETGVDLT